MAARFCVTRAAMRVAIFVSEPRCFDFENSTGQQFSGVLAFSDRISLCLSENTDIREWWSSWNQDDDVDGTGATTDFRAPREAPDGASLRADFAPLRLKRRRLITMELEIGDEPIRIG